MARAHTRAEETLLASDDVFMCACQVGERIGVLLPGIIIYIHIVNTKTYYTLYSVWFLWYDVFRRCMVHIMYIIYTRLCGGPPSTIYYKSEQTVNLHRVFLIVIYMPHSHETKYTHIFGTYILYNIA